MKRSLFSPLNIIIVAVAAALVWFYMNYMHKKEEVAVQEVTTEQVAPAEEVAVVEVEETEAPAQQEAEEAK